MGKRGTLLKELDDSLVKVQTLIKKGAEGEKLDLYRRQLSALVEIDKKICDNSITLYRCLFCSYIFTKRESKLYSLRSIPTDIKSPVGNGYSKALTHLLTRQVTKSHLYKVFLL